MINLALSEEQEQFQKLSREFADGEIVPESEAFDRSAAFPERILEKAWEIGLVNFQVSEDLGGMGLSTVDSCVILEELAAGCSGISAAIEASAIAQLPLILAGTDDQQEAFLQPLIDSPSVAGYASQDATTYDITAEPSGSDFILNGTHGALVNGGHSIWYFVVAEHIETNSSSAFIVPADAEGLSITGRVETPGRRARAVTKLNLDQVKLSSDHLIGSLSRADKVIESILPSMHLLIASGALGVASRALDHALSYSKQRHTFGRPISQHQGVSFMLADMAREIEAARLLIRHAAKLIDNNQVAYDKAASAKAFAQDVAMKVTTDAVQIYGGYGYSKEYPVEKLMRDALIYKLSEQSANELKAAHARHLLGSTKRS